jgi:glycosyltransferase involved in cell wall biosynthesis
MPFVIDKMKVSVIVPFREKNRKILRCLKSIKNQDYKNLEVIIISDRIELKKPGTISIFNQDCEGAGSKRNLGAENSEGEILLFLDSDCILKNDSITKLVKIFKTKEVDAVSGEPLAYEKSNLLGLITGLEYEDRFEQMGEGYVDVTASTCLGIKRNIFFKVNGFIDYSIHEAIGEDWDFSARLKKGGHTIYHTNKVKVFHEHSSETLGYYLKRQYGHAKYRITHFRVYENATDQYSSWAMIISSTLLLGIPATIRILWRTKNLKVLVLPLISILRTAAWISGAIVGIFSLEKSDSR